jgi:predicted dehydrogenase
MTERIVRFAVVGCGRVSANHLDALTRGSIPARLTAVCDVDPEKARAKGERHRVPWFADYHAMIAAHPEIEALSVCTPTGLHARHVTDLARHGRHIVVEKPMALSVADCRAMIAACGASGARLFVVKQNRFNPAVVAARAALEAGRFGKLVMGTVRLRWRRDQPYYEQDDWHGTWAMDGGVMSQQASHHLDLLQWFFGRVETVQCRTATRLLDIEVEDTAASLVAFESGALGIYEATVAARPEDLEASISILGERGSVIISGRAVNRIQYWKFDEAVPGDDGVVERFSTDVPNVYGHGHGPYLAQVAESILGGTRGLVEGADGLTNVEILTALYESAACGGQARRPGCRQEKSLLGVDVAKRAGTEPAA